MGPYPRTNIDSWLEGIKATIGEDGVDDFWALQTQLFNSSAVVYVTVPKDSSPYSAYDAGAFGYGLLLATAERGISGVPAYEFIRFPREVREVFDIPEDEALFMCVGLGYPKEASSANTIKLGRNGLDQFLQIRD